MEQVLNSTRMEMLVGQHILGGEEQARQKIQDLVRGAQERAESLCDAAKAEARQRVAGKVQGLKQRAAIMVLMIVMLLGIYLAFHGQIISWRLFCPVLSLCGFFTLFGALTVNANFKDGFYASLDQ